MPGASLPPQPQGPPPSVSPPVSKQDKDKETNETVEFTASEVTLDQALKMWRDAKKYVDTGFRIRWDNYFKVYSGERVDPSYFGTIKVNNREAHSIIETLVANIAGGLPSFHFIPTNEEQNTDTSLLNGCVDYYMNYNDMDLKNQIWVRDMLMYGTGILHVSWRDGKAYIENIPLRDFFVDPTSTDLVKTQTASRYAGFEYLASKDDLEATQIFDAETGQMKAKYDLAGVGDAPTTGSNGGSVAMDKAFKDMFNGSTLDQADAVQRQVHVVLIYDLVSGKVMEIGNQRKFIYYDDTTLQRKEDTRTVQVAFDGKMIDSKQTLDEIRPFLPFAILRDYVDSSLFYGEGEMSVLMGDSELLNDYEAMDADNTAYQNTPMYTIDPQFADMADEIETIAGAVYPLPKGALSPIELAQTGEGIAIKKNEIIQRMRSGTAADEAVQGISQAKGRTTATEVNSQLQQAQGRFTTKITNLGAGGYTQLASILFKMMCIFLTPSQSIRMVGKEGITFNKFDPWDWNGEYEPQVKLDSQIKQQQVEVGMKNNQIFQTLDATPGIFDPVKIARFKIQHIDTSFTDQDFNDLLAAPAPPQKPSVRDFVQLDKIYAIATPFIKSQIETEIGLQPDPVHQGEEQVLMHQQAGAIADQQDPSTDSQGKVLPHIAAALNTPAPVGAPPQ